MAQKRMWWLILLGVFLARSFLGPPAEGAAACTLWDSQSSVLKRCPGGVFPTTCAAGVTLQGIDPADGTFKICQGGTSSGVFVPIERIHTALTNCASSVTTATIGEQCFSLDNGERPTCTNPQLTGSATQCDNPTEWSASGFTTTPTLSQVLLQGRMAEDVVGEANFVKLGDLGLDSFISLGVDASDGPTIITQCNGGPCDKRFVLGTGKEFAVGTDVLDGFILREAANGVIRLREQTSDPATPPANYRDLYPKSDGFYQKNSAGTVSQIGAGGGNPVPIRPSSAIPVTAGMVYGCPVDGDQMLCVANATTLTSDAIWRLTFQLPPTLDTGCTYTLVVDLKANATSGVARLNPKWAAWSVGAARPTSLSAETVTPTSVTGAAGAGDTVTWGTGDTHQLIRVKWTLNATTLPLGGEKLAIDLTAEDASYTLATELGMDPYVTCE